MNCVITQQLHGKLKRKHVISPDVRPIFTLKLAAFGLMK